MNKIIVNHKIKKTIFKYSYKYSLKKYIIKN